MILEGDKELMHRAEIKPVDVGAYPELAVKHMYKEFSSRKICAKYLPPKINNGRSCPKEYFWDIVNTLYEEEVDAMVKHANQQRTGTDSATKHADNITMSTKMAKLMAQYPFAR